MIIFTFLFDKPSLGKSLKYFLTVLFFLQPIFIKHIHELHT